MSDHTQNETGNPVTVSAASAGTQSSSERSETATVIPVAAEETVTSRDSKSTSGKFQLYPPTSRETAPPETTSRKRQLRPTASAAEDQFRFRPKSPERDVKKPCLANSGGQGHWFLLTTGAQRSWRN